MIVDPMVKNDLLLVKDAIERKLYEQNTRGADLAQLAGSVRGFRQVHRTIKTEIYKYPTAKATDENLLNKNKRLTLQQECIPCLSRVKSLLDIDTYDDVYSMLLAYNSKIMDHFLNLFKGMNRPNRIQMDLCIIYAALRSQCIPDLRRLLIGLEYLITDLKSINFKQLRLQLFELIGSFLMKIVVSATIRYDLFIRLVTDTLKCVANDINVQLRKLQPILSSDGIENTIEVFKGKKTLNTQELVQKMKSGQWLPNQEDDEGNPVRFDIPKTVSNKMDTIIKKVGGAKDVFTLNTQGSNIAGLISGYVDEVNDKIDSKFKNAQSELLKFLKLKEGNLGKQIYVIEQIGLIRNLIEVIKTIIDTRGDFDPCGPEAGQAFFTKLRIPGSRIAIDRRRPDPSQPPDTEINISPPEIIVNNPVVEEILNNAGINTVTRSSDLQGSRQILTAGKFVEAEEISISISRCLDGAK